MSTVVVIGAGLAGLSSALMLSESGHRVSIVARGWGGLLLSKGTIDILGWINDGASIASGTSASGTDISSTKTSGNSITEGASSTDFTEGTGGTGDQPVVAVAPALADFIAAHPEHPYASIGAKHVLAGTAWLARQLPFFASESAPEKPGDLTNKLLPTAIGAVQPSAFVPESMEASILTAGGHYLIVGIDNFKDFHAHLVADNLAACPYVHVHTRAASITLPLRSDRSDDDNPDATGTTIARRLDICDGDSADGERSPEFISLVEQLAGLARTGETVLLPAVLGLSPQTYATLSAQLGVPVGEIPLPPPSIPGRRMHDFLVHQCRERRIDILLNAEAVGVTPHAETGDSGAPSIRSVAVRVAGRVKQLPADAVVYAGGGFGSGALERDSFGHMRDTVCSAPVWSPNGDIFGSGLRVDQWMRPTSLPTGVDRSAGESASAIFTNLYCAGDIIGGALPWNEGSGEGIALGSAFAAAEAVNAMDRAHVNHIQQEPSHQRNIEADTKEDR